MFRAVLQAAIFEEIQDRCLIQRVTLAGKHKRHWKGNVKEVFPTEPKTIGEF